LVDGLAAVILAPTCAACRTPLPEPSRGALCQFCWDAIALHRPDISDLPPRPSLLSSSGAIGAYEGRLRDAIHALKYDGRRSLARPLGELMRECGGGVLDSADLVVPVPLHFRRHYARGFNQAEDLARALGLPVTRALRRRRHTPSQTDLPADARHLNVRNAFRLRSRAGVAGRCIVLVDDVSTTGATLEACARVLLTHGAREVRALTAARVASRLR
jgi:ComF family protein